MNQFQNYFPPGSTGCFETPARERIPYVRNGTSEHRKSFLLKANIRSLIKLLTFCYTLYDGCLLDTNESGNARFKGVIDLSG